MCIGGRWVVQVCEVVFPLQSDLFSIFYIRVLHFGKFLPHDRKKKLVGSVKMEFSNLKIFSFIRGNRMAMHIFKLGSALDGISMVSWERLDILYNKSLLC